MTHTTGAVADAGTVGSRSVALLVSQLRWAVLALAIVIPAILNQNFRSYDNLQGFLQSIGVLLILAMGQSFVLLIAGIDLSVGAVLAMGSVVLADLLQHGWPLWAAVSGTLVAGLGIGLLSGASVLILNNPSFNVTFPFMAIAYAPFFVANRLRTRTTPG